MPRIIAPAEFRTQPWKNGGGVTHEIVRWPDNGACDKAYDIRVSLAEVRAPGPFSRFPGYRRWSFLAAGAPIALDERSEATGGGDPDGLPAGRGAAPRRGIDVAGVVHELVALGDPLEVGGDVAISCALPAGPTRLLNVLVRDGIAAQVGRGPCPLPVRLVFALAGLPWLPEGHAAVFEPAAHAVLERHAVWLA